VTLGESRERLLEFTAALKAFEKASDAAEAAGAGQLVSTARLSAARLHARFGDIASARSVLTQVGAEARRTENWETLSFSLVGLASIAVTERDGDGPFELLDEAFRVARAERSASAKGHALACVGVGLLLEDRHERARDMFGRAALLYQRAKDVESLGKTYNNLGVSYYLDRGRFADAIPYLELGLEFLGVEADLGYVMNSLSNNARAFESYYIEPAVMFRKPVPALLGVLENRLVPRLGDATVMPVGPLSTAEGATFFENPIVVEPVLYLALPAM
jgi:tetratricopeptide (TPR) repeat protein